MSRQMHRALYAAFLLAAISLACIAEAGNLSQGNVQAGEHFYRTGLTANGKPVAVEVQGDVNATSDRFACMACHRPSGFGSSEGGEYTPIIISSVLFSPQKADQLRRNRRFHNLFKERQTSSYNVNVRMPRMRPGYDAATLARAIRDGIDSAGRTLSKTMPRYHLTNHQVANLIAYLKTLSAKQSAGVSKHEIHLATVFSDGVDPGKRAAVLKTLQVFAKWFNEDIADKLHRRGFSPYYRSDFRNSYRKWKLHVWTLHGPQNTWGRQLQAYYKKQPVFVEISGLVDGSWKPVDTFCEKEKLPCLYPNTALPVTQHTRYGYSIYFSRGLMLEGEALAKYLGQRKNPPTTIYQIRMDDAAGKAPTKGFFKAAETYLPDAEIRTVSASSAAKLKQAIAAAASTPADVLVIWPGTASAAAVTALNKHPPAEVSVTLPSTALVTARADLSPAVARKLRLTYRFEKPSAYHSWQYEVRAWFDTRRLKVTHQRLQYQTWYAMTQLQRGMGDIIDDYYRDYLVEFLEHEAEGKINPGVYPTLALGPGQRFASKGAYIVKLDAKAKDGITAVSNWIVP